jgi:hypothetical protein
MNTIASLLIVCLLVDGGWGDRLPPVVSFWAGITEVAEDSNSRHFFSIGL